MSNPVGRATNQGTAENNAQTILVICSFAWSVVSFRGDMIKALESEGYNVLCAVPDSPGGSYPELDAHGINYVSYPLARSGMNPIKDLVTLFALTRIIRKHKINVVFPYTIKPVIYGTLAGRVNRIPVIALITGLGLSFSGTSRKARALEILNTLMYRVAISGSTHLIFQNADDLALFEKKGIARNKSRCSVVDGSGINIESFPQRDYGSYNGPVRFLMVARLIEEKGVMLYIEAAQTLKKEFPDVVFSLVGSSETTPSAVDPAIIQRYHEEGSLRFVGKLDDVTPEYQAADVFVLPTYYREGIPRSILEALSSGMAVVTTDSPGCRETVENNVNGFLVKTQDVTDLTDKLRTLISQPEKVKEMGMASRKLAESRFNVTVINGHIVKVFETALLGS